MPRFQKSQLVSKKGFTLVELMITIGIVSIIGTTVILTLNPQEQIRRARDARRLAELATLDKALALFALSSPQGYTGSSSVVYVSLPDASPTCQNLSLPSLPGGWSYACVTESNLRKIDSQGWIPVDFASISTGRPFAALPVDPVNSDVQGLYYTYAVGSWELTAKLESLKYASTKAAEDGGDDSNRYETGTRKVALTPATLGVSSITPSSGPNQGTTTISSITGNNFKAGASVKLSRVGQADIPGIGFTVQSTTTILGGTFYLEGTLTGPWDVMVSNPSGESGLLPQGFTMFESAPPPPPPPPPPP